jgi:hypothetical protein
MFLFSNRITPIINGIDVTRYTFVCKCGTQKQNLGKQTECSARSNYLESSSLLRMRKRALIRGLFLVRISWKNEVHIYGHQSQRSETVFGILHENDGYERDKQRKNGGAHRTVSDPNFWIPLPP